MGQIKKNVGTILKNENCIHEKINKGKILGQYCHLSFQSPMVSLLLFK
jgi:hypothetical protein